MRWLVLLLLVIVDVALAMSTTAVSDILKTAEDLRVKDPIKTVEYIAEIESRLRELTPEERQRLQILIAHQKAIKGNLDGAISDLSALDGAEKPAPTRARAGALLAQLHLAKSDYISAFTSLEGSLKASHKVTEPHVRIDVLEVAARLFAAAGQYDKAKQYASEAIMLATESKDAMRQCFSWAGYIAAEREKNGSGAAMEPSFKMVKACEDQSELHVGLTLINIVDGLIERTNLDEAETVLKRSEKILKQKGYTPGLAALNLAKARLEMARGNNSGAVPLLLSAKQTATDLGINGDHVSALELLAKIAMYNGQWQNAANYYQQLRVAEKTNLDRSIKINQSFLQVQFDSQLQEYELTKLAQANELLLQKSKSQDDLRQLMQFAIAVILVICILLMMSLHRLRNQSLQLRKLAQIDGLTGLHNRRHALMLAEQLYASCLRRNSPLAVVMVDLDLFKEINDRFGHAAGDEVLRNAARHFASCLRKQDVIGRTGGEEFAIFLPDTNLNAAMSVVERCRNGLGDVQEGAQRRSVTASFGIAVAINDRFTLDELLQQADKALYSAKANGRNQVAIARDLAFAASAYDEPASLI